MAEEPSEPDELPLLEEMALLEDIRRGLADLEAGRVVPHEEVMARLLDRYK